jgi:Spy/CpxP family protein refolding chaperone
MALAYSMGKEEAKMKRILIGFGALVVVVAAGAAWAQGARQGARQMVMKQVITAKVAEAEDLIQATPEQRTQIEKSRDAVIAAFQAARKDHKDMHDQLVKLWTADKLSESDLNTLAAQRAQDMQAVASVVAHELAQVHDALTPAQRQTLVDKLPQLRQHHQHPKGGFGGPGE